jgi:hypothetical protein
MSDMIDDGNDQEEFEQGTFEDLLEQPAQEQPKEPPRSDPPPEDDLPEKYRGKSAKEIAKMHMEAEREMGRKGSEVGELRKIVDDFIRNQNIREQQKQPPEQDEEVDFFADPQKAIDRAIAKHPKVKEAEVVAAQLKKAEVTAQLKNLHPDFTEVVQSEDFVEWVKASKVRQELALRADAAYDIDAANELLSTFKERKDSIKKTMEAESSARKQAVKSASTGATRGSGTEGMSKKIYRRADIIQLMMSNPDRYQALQPEIMKAYSEGRVK